jgi:hypothetical protein
MLLHWHWPSPWLLLCWLRGPILTGRRRVLLPRSSYPNSAGHAALLELLLLRCYAAVGTARGLAGLALQRPTVLLWDNHILCSLQWVSNVPTAKQGSLCLQETLCLI